MGLQMSSFDNFLNKTSGKNTADFSSPILNMHPVQEIFSYNNLKHKESNKHELTEYITIQSILRLNTATCRMHSKEY